MNVLTSWMIWINIVNISSHPVRKQSSAWKYSFFLSQHHFGDFYACHIFRVYGRISRIFLSIRAMPDDIFAGHDLYPWTQNYRFRRCRISTTNRNYLVLMALVPTFLPDTSWMSSLMPAGVGASGQQVSSESDGDSSCSRLALGDLVRLSAKSPWWNFERTGF